MTPAAARSLAVPDRWPRRFAVAGGAAALLSLIGLWAARDQFFISYLFAYAFWFLLAAGAFGILLIHHVTGGAWGDIIRPQLNAAVLTLPLLGLLFLPILGGLHVLYPWSRAAAAADPLMRHKHIYLNVPFFFLRALFFFALWSFMAKNLNRWSASSNPADAEMARRRSAPGLMVYALTMSFAVLDWLMSIEPRWYSTMFEGAVIIGGMLTAFAFMAFTLHRLLAQRDGEIIKPYWDLGNLTLAFVMLWAYLSFSQYLIIFSGNIPEEITWYLHRQQGGWFWGAMALVAFQFVLPFLILLGRRNKQKLERLARVALLILAIGVFHVFWVVEPTFFPGHLHVHWLDAALFAGIGGIWLAAFFGQLRKQPAFGTAGEAPR